MTATFSVIVPTIARATLRFALDSIANQLRPGDELLVLCNSDGDSGNSARNNLIARAQGSHLIFLDDDDEFLPDALDSMRRFAEQNPDRVGIFRMRYELYGDVWRRGTLDEFTTSMAVVPNVAGRVGRFTPADLSDPLVRDLRSGETPAGLAIRWGDYEFIRSTLELRGDEPLWVPVVTTVIRPERRKLVRLRYRMRVRSRIRRIRRQVTGRDAL